MSGLHGEAMVWAIIGIDGLPITGTYADHAIAAWHRYIQLLRPAGCEDAVTMVIDAQNKGCMVQCLSVRASVAPALRAVR